MHKMFHLHKNQSVLWGFGGAEGDHSDGIRREGVNFILMRVVKTNL